MLTKKLFLVPVGLPGMGKSTLAKNLRKAIEMHNMNIMHPNQQEFTKSTQSQDKLNISDQLMIHNAVKPYLPKKFIF